MLCWRFIIHNTLSTYVVLTGGKTCCVGGLPYITYVVLEVKHVVLEVYHT